MASAVKFSCAIIIYVFYLNIMIEYYYRILLLLFILFHALIQHFLPEASVSCSIALIRKAILQGQIQFMPFIDADQMGLM